MLAHAEGSRYVFVESLCVNVKSSFKRIEVYDLKTNSWVAPLNTNGVDIDAPMVLSRDGNTLAVVGVNASNKKVLLVYDLSSLPK